MKIGDSGEGRKYKMYDRQETRPLTLEFGSHNFDARRPVYPTTRRSELGFERAGKMERMAELPQGC